MMKLHEFIELSSLFVVFADAKCRRLLIIALALLLIIITLLIHYYPSSTSVPKIGHNNHPTSYIKWIDVSRRIDVPFHLINHQCSMSSCFNRTKCTSPPYRVYVYPDINNDTKRSDSYSKILKVIRDSRLYTSNATEACLFILSIDTLDRDKLSANFVHDIDQRIDALPVDLWNGGNNHIIFNLYHGTYPDYGDHDLKFRLGNAIIARASASVQHFRVNFDISLPLFHRELPIRSTVELELPITDPRHDRHLLSFKGKRYVYGIGSETRNFIYHLHNGESIAMVTTCEHNFDWRKHADARCAVDNSEYESWNYEAMMRNSTFCLVPRGRRLGSFRFLEALRFGCIPVILSDGWVLPFAEVIDWSGAVVFAHERALIQVSDVLRSISTKRILSMKQRARLLYRNYFSSVDKIISTALTIIIERLRADIGEQPKQWNTLQSAIMSHSIALSSTTTFTGLVVASQTAKSAWSSRLQKLVTILSSISSCEAIVVLWPIDRPRPQLSRFNDKVIIIPIETTHLNYSQQLYIDRDVYVGDAIFMLDERVSLSSDDIKFTIECWKSFPDRLVGFYARTHRLDGDRWSLSEIADNSYSIILPYAAIIHRSYIASYHNWLTHSADQLANNLPECHHLLMNAMITDYTQRAPILIGNRQIESWMTTNLSTCFDQLLAHDIWQTPPPLMQSHIRFDPLLFLDDVSNFRKKYRRMEQH